MPRIHDLPDYGPALSYLDKLIENALDFINQTNEQIETARKTVAKAEEDVVSLTRAAEALRTNGQEVTHIHVTPLNRKDLN